MTIAFQEHADESGRARPADPPIQVTRWPTEIPLLVVSVAISIALWIVLLFSVVGIAYALLVGLFFFVVRVAFMAHVRGSGVRLGPDQFPALHARVTELARRMGLDPVPDTYIMQAGGALNAFATRFFGRNFVVLYSDLLDACGADDSARDMIIAHELGHVHAGHLRAHLLLLPSAIIPFLGAALSRAREYTSDRYGLAGAGSRAGAALGMTILAAGASHGRLVNRKALVRQREDLNTGWMTIGEWFASHPPIARRLAQLDPDSVDTPVGVARGRLSAIAIIALGVVLPITGLVMFARGPVREALRQIQRNANLEVEKARVDGSAPTVSPFLAPLPEVGIARARDDLTTIAAAINARVAAGQQLPWDAEELYAWWTAAHPGAPEPTDPFDGDRYGYDWRGRDFRLWSSGPDQRSNTLDDIVYDSRAAAIVK
jgi:Zn-dependent protease with chaperone function